MDDEAVKVGQVDSGAEVQGDAAPVLKLVGARGAVRYAAAFVVVVLAGSAGPVAVWNRAAPQALRVAALILSRARSLSTCLRTHCRETGRGEDIKARFLLQTLLLNYFLPDLSAIAVITMNRKLS